MDNIMDNAMEDARENYITLLLGAGDGPIPSALHLRDGMFMVSKGVPMAAELFDFEPGIDGPYSKALDRILGSDAHRDSPYWKRDGHVALTADGRKELEKITAKYEDDARFSELMWIMGLVRKLYDRFTRDQMLFLTCRTHPDYVVVPGPLDDPAYRGDLLSSLKPLLTDERYEELLQIEVGELKETRENLAEILNHIEKSEDNEKPIKGEIRVMHASP